MIVSINSFEQAKKHGKKMRRKVGEKMRSGYAYKNKFYYEAGKTKQAIEFAENLPIAKKRANPCPKPKKKRKTNPESEFKKITRGKEKGKYRRKGKVYTPRQMRAFYATEGFTRKPKRPRKNPKEKYIPGMPYLKPRIHGGLNVFIANAKGNKLDKMGYVLNENDAKKWLKNKGYEKAIIER